MAEQIRPESHTGQASEPCEKHTDVWRFISNENDIKLFNRAFSNKGNAFLIGKDLEYLYNGLRSVLAGNPLHRHHLILSWESPPGWLRIDWKAHETFMEIHYRNPDVTLRHAEPNMWHVIEVDDLANYIQKDSGNLRTKILYFKDERFRLHTVDLMYKPSSNDDLEATQHQYAFEMEKEHSRDSPVTFYLQEKNSLSTPKKPKIPWHERN
ncbi:hypothetical protein BGZ61DRAFT_537673 [Ilyonectria robusta]|uniref:uncharacterized protein n=1 Tax=Ilyonectria robusta TaxID=1079257 RepID=UPI001E8DDF15|nr:uncharacterized protein BGZ61DRAFT_537673 [Ilyonectria robusta]KAH8669211.1 hypothetical protein BGZ61DRAFT_537673 [Ilyonectria robusta]